MRTNYFKRPINKRFIDAFPKFENINNADKDKNGTPLVYFWEGWTQSPFFNTEITKSEMYEVYNHLLAEYYNWHFKYMDDLGIALNTYKTVAQYFPNTKERLSLATQLREMSLDDYAKSSISINSGAQNPKIETAMDELVNLVEQQNASFQLKSGEVTIRAKFTALFDGIWDDFCLRFRYQYVKLYSGVNDYIFTNKFDKDDAEEEEED